MSARLLAPYADYLVVNVSSPNTPGLRDLQAVERLEPLLAPSAPRRDAAEPVPLLVKIAPDLDDDDVLAVADLAIALGLDGIIATNTTISRDGLPAPAADVEAARRRWPLRRAADRPSLEVLRLLRQTGSARDLTLVSVGGITTVEDAPARLEAGATLLQAYTALRLRGPAVAPPDRARDRTTSTDRPDRGPSTSPASCWRRRSAPTAT